MAEFEDDYPVLDLSAQPAATEQPADDYPVLDPATIHGSNVPRPPEDDYPVLNQEQQPRGVQTRVTEAFQENYKPILDKAIEKAAPDFAKKHPIISNLLQGAIGGSPIGTLDKLIAGVNALPGAAAGAVAGLAEKNPKATFPIGLSRMEADRLQRDIDVWGKAFMFESGMGTAGALSHGRSAQIGDIGREGFRDLRKQGQTPGSTSSPGATQEPNPPAAQPVADVQNKTTLGTGATETGGENLNTRNYGKTTPAAAGEASGVNVIKDGVDPTVASTFKPAEPPAAAAPAELPAAAPAAPAAPLAVARGQPPMGRQVPTAEQAAAAQERIAARRQPPQTAEPIPGLLAEKQPFYDAAKAAAPNLSHEQLLHIANLSGGPKGAALMARNTARRMAEDVGAVAPTVGDQLKAQQAEKIAAAARPAEVLREPEPAAPALAGMSEKDLRRTMVDGNVSPATRAAAKAELQSRLAPTVPKIDTRTADEIEIAKEHGRDATLAEMAAENASMSPKDIALEYYESVGQSRHAEALKLFDQENSANAIAADTKLATARNIIAQAAKESQGPLTRAGAKERALAKKQLDYAVKEALSLRLHNGIQPTDPAIIAEIAKRDAARNARADARTEKIRAEVAAGRPAPPDVRPVDRVEEIRQTLTAPAPLPEPVGTPLARSRAIEQQMREERAATARPPADYTGKLNPEISHTEYVNRMQDLRDNKPPPINKLWNNPDAAPPKSLAAAQQAIKVWEREYRAVNRNQKLALERDNAAFRVEAAKRGEQPVEAVTPAPAKNVQQLVEEAKQRQELTRRGHSDAEVDNMTAAEVNRIYEGKPSEEALAERADPGVEPTSAGAAAAPPPAPPPASVTQRARTHISDTLRAAYDKFLDIGNRAVSEVQMHVAPMATGKDAARAMVKDHAEAMRRIDYEWTVADDHIQKHFTPEQQKRMWDAADEENVMRQRGETSEHMGIATLEPNERALVESFQVKARELWQRAREIGWVEGEGLPYYTPRMISNIVERGGGPRVLDQYRSDITTSTPQVKRRKYMEAEETEAAAKKAFGDEAELVRNIRTMPLVLAKMEKALAGRALINKIKEAGRAAGENTVMEGGKPNEPGWFTIPENPAFYTNRPRMERADTPVYRERVGSHGVVEVPDAQIPLLDRNGNPVMDRVPLWVRGDFEGPLRSIMHRPSGMLYSGFMGLKGRTMQLIMNSPMIHNAVEWGRAFPTMPGKMLTFQTYFEGNAAKRGVPYNGTARYVTDWATGKLEQAPRNASPVMIEAINAGMVPIGKRFAMQDLTGILEQPNLTPGRSFTAKVLGMVPDLFDPRAGDAVKRAIDRAGDFWHNTMLWDRVGDLQAGIYVNAKKDLLAHGVDDLSAQRVAAHVANRYAGALPQEAMSGAARKIANVMMFSRSFTLGNLGVMKDMVTGLPRDVKAQIARDIGSIDPKAADYVKALARRKAMGIVAIDVGLMYVGNSLLQSAFNLLQDDNTLGKEAQGYVRRFNDAMQRVHEDPLSLMQPLTMLESLSSTYENEPDKKDRIMVGTNQDGRALYMRNPIGKIGEEFVGYASKPIKQMLAKMSTMARPGWQILANDKGFGQKIYDPNAETIPGYLLDVLYPIVKQIVTAQTPEGQMKAFKDFMAGENVQKVGGVPVNAYQAFGPLGGFTFSQGHPGGPAAGELARFNEMQKFKMGPELTDIRKLVRDGKMDEAVERLNILEVDPNLRKQILNPHMPSRAIRDLYRHGAPAQVERFERKRE